MANYDIVTILVDYRTKEAVEVQKVLTENGCKIKTRLGVHEANDNYCAEDGLIIVNLFGSESEIDKLVNDLNAINGVLAKHVNLNND